MGFLTGKTAIITGAGRAVLKDGSCGSIGYGIATAYALSLIHISEPTRRTPISYAVFCLKKKKKPQWNTREA